MRYDPVVLITSDDSDPAALEAAVIVACTYSINVLDEVSISVVLILGLLAGLDLYSESNVILILVRRCRDQFFYAVVKLRCFHIKLLRSL